MFIQSKKNQKYYEKRPRENEMIETDLKVIGKLEFSDTDFKIIVIGRFRTKNDKVENFILRTEIYNKKCHLDTLELKHPYSASGLVSVRSLSLNFSMPNFNLLVQLQ